MPETRYNVALLAPPGYPHAMAFGEVARLLVAALTSLHVPVTFQPNQLDPDAVNIILGYHLVRTPASLRGIRYIPYQLEQFSPDSPWSNERIDEVLRGAMAVWDYSEQNIAVLHARGIHHVKWLPIGYHEHLETIPPADTEDIDVLHYGTLNDRRKHTLEALAKHCRVKHLEGVYGDERDAFIARAKLVLNVHYYETKIQAQVRISYLLNNRRAVVAEASEPDPLRAMVHSAAYDDLVPACLQLLADEPARRALAARGYALFRERPMTRYLQSVL